MNIIEVDAVDYLHTVPGQAMPKIKVLDALNLAIAQGESVALVGCALGTSTLLRLCNALLLPTGGQVRIGGIDTRDLTQRWELRRMVGMIFADADSQIIGATVAEDVAFGPENLGWAPRIIQCRVREALQVVGMEQSGDRATHHLSSAEKLRLALAGVVAMQPACILLDNAAALLDPTEREAFLSLLRGVNREMGITIVQATSNRTDAAMADRILLLAEGKIVFAGTPSDHAGSRPLPAEFARALPAGPAWQVAAGIAT